MSSLLQSINDDMNEYVFFLKSHDIKPIADMLYDDKLYNFYNNYYWNSVHNIEYKSYNIPNEDFKLAIMNYYESIKGDTEYYKNLESHVNTFVEIIKKEYSKTNI